MKIAVCDDSREERDRLIAMLREYCGARNICAEFAQYNSGETFLEDFAPGAFSLVFLDIYMGGMSGVEAAKTLKDADYDCIIIFTTTSREHGADAFDLDAFYYFVKPFTREKLFSVMNKWYDAFCAWRTIALKCGRTTREVLIRDILYIDVLGRNSTVHTASEAIETAAPLTAVEMLLPAGEFIRLIRYCLAALRHIGSVGEDFVILSNGERLAISRRERENIRQQLAAYRLRALRRR
ncbi:MAG: LytTR family DNA-binding domain-containing protein [Clostridia bacterium]|nr:LytTR family DNA-binding domain-containing protein [Clostridia bacterium]